MGIEIGTMKFKSKKKTVDAGGRVKCSVSFIDSEDNKLTVQVTEFQWDEWNSGDEVDPSVFFKQMQQTLDQEYPQ